MKKILFLSILTLFLHGCATRSTSLSYVNEHISVNLSDNIATDLVSFISNDYPAGHTTLFLLHPTENIDNSFSYSLENQLRSTGYTIEENKGLPLSYTIDNIENSNYFLKVTLDKSTVTRMYNNHGMATSNWTIKVSNTVNKDE